MPCFVRDKRSNNGRSDFKYETTVENKQGGSVFEYLWNLSEVRKENRILIPMKKLLLDYQGVTKK